MKSTFTWLFTLGICLLVSAQEKETITQNRADLVGIKTLADFKQAPNKEWFDSSYYSYKLDSKTINKLKKHTKGIEIKVFMSVWCHDSHREIPRLYKILEAIQFDTSKLEVVALDRTKKTPEDLQEGYHIVRTPTIIFYKNAKELARFVEKPRVSLEKDMLKIMSEKPYKHAYQKD